MDTSPEPLMKFRESDNITVGTVFTTSMLDAMNVTQFGDEVLRYVGEHPNIHLMLSFENVDYLSSAALTELLRINEAVTAEKGSVRLCGLSKDIQKVFEITKLDGLFAIQKEEDVQHALTRFKRSIERAAEEEAWERGGRNP